MNLTLERLYDATDNLIDQQFYRSGQDIITGRTPEVSIKIRTSGQIIKKYKDLFNQNIDSFLEGKYLQFLSQFKKIKGINEENIKEINEELEGKIEILKDTTDDFDAVILYTIVLSSLISRIRNFHFNNSIDEIKKRVKNKTSISDNKIKEELDKLFMRNNNNISILYNLSYLDALAESFNYGKVAHICKIQKGKYINRVVNLILSTSN